MNIYGASAALGVTSVLALSAIYTFGGGGQIGGFGSVDIRPHDPVDIQIAPYLAPIRYEGSSALVPISIAFRVDGKTNGLKFCKDIVKVQRAVNAFMRERVGKDFSWKNVKRSGLDKQLTARVNDLVGNRLVMEIHMSAGNLGQGDQQVTCGQLARLK